MEIRKITKERFGFKNICKVVSGYALYEPGKGYIAYSYTRDKFGILTPYIPNGGRKALQSIISAGGFTSLDGIEYVNPIA